MWNPFKAIGGAIAGAGKAIGKAVGGGLSKVGGGLSKAGDKMSGKSTPKAPPAPPAPPQRRVTIPIEKPPAPTPAPTKKLPPSMTGGARPSGGMARDDAILGADSDAERSLNEAIKDFEADNSLMGLSREARDFLAHPSYAAIFEKYAPGGGFAPDQWVTGMKDPHNFRITRTGDQIEIIFDGDFDMGGDYDLGGRSPYATF